MKTLNKNISVNEYTELTRDHLTRYVADITHLQYGEHKIIKDYDKSIVEHKVAELIEKWQQRENKERNAELAEEMANLLKTGSSQSIDVVKLYENEVIDKELAESNDIIQETKAAIKLLKTTIESQKVAIESNRCYQNNLSEPQAPAESPLLDYPTEPQRSYFTPEYKTIHRVLPFLKSMVDAKKRKEFDTAYQNYKHICSEIDEINDKEKRRCQARKTLYKRDRQNYEDKLSAHKKEEAKLKTQLADSEILLTKKEGLLAEETVKYKDARQAIRLKIKELIAELANEEKEAIEVYTALLLGYSQYPIQWDKNVSLSYDSGFIAIDYSLPSMDKFSSVAGMRFIKKDRGVALMTDKAFATHYDNALYQIALRSIYEVFADKYLGAVNSIVFNGWVTALNTANGKTETNCIMSIKTNREQISGIDFQNVNPKDCFKSLKGVASSQLSTITAIKPIVILNKADRRFVEHYSVEGDLDDSTNLASMHWEDFEHLIRELFEQEFSHNGGEVKVTQTSRDGGVDAIAFDPDPIRGGKIVIQAKRYTNTVGVSAVRDLYGTVLNEGATKGILVTTSDYGGDSYEFAKDKPITLMNGSNLLYLLEKHGQRARIDIKEAKKMEKQNQ